MSAGSPEKLVYMANQIAKFFATQPGGLGAVKTADHLRAFWEPNMRKAIVAYVAAGGAGLDPMAREAVALLTGAPEGAVRAALEAAGEPTARAPGDDAG